MIPCRPLLAALAGLCILLFLTSIHADPDAGPRPTLRLKHGEFDPLTALPAVPAHLRHDTEPRSGVFIVQFDDDIRPGLLASLRATGARPLKYVPDRGYLVRLPVNTIEAVRSLPGVRWLGAVEPAWKISPDLGTRPFVDPARRADGLLYATVDLFPGEDPDRIAGELAATGVEVLHVARIGGASRLRIHGRLEHVEAVAWNDAVSWIDELGEITHRNNQTRWVIQSDVPSSTPIWDQGLHGENQIIGHIDGRIDMNSCYFRDAVDNTPGPGHRKVVAYRSSSGLGADSHGTHTAGTAGGDQSPINGTLDNNGIAYAARISHSVSGDVAGYGNTASNLYSFLEAAHDDGARVHTNSWGDDGRTTYTTWCVDIDRFSYDYEDSLVLFAVTNTGTLRTPENAKNVLAVGATQPGSQNDLHCTGGIGPTSDGRRKPEIYAPGCQILSARNGSDCATRSSGGTSMACPAVAGAGALVRQYFEEGRHPTGTAVPADALSPSGALVKATLLNSTVDMTAVSGYPSDLEGWGRVLLDNALFFPGDVRRLSILDDLRNADGLSTGNDTVYPLNVDDSQEPLKVTLVYTEPAAALLASVAVVNDLDLEVRSPSGSLYLGNVISTANGVSVSGGNPDALNNVEMVILENPEVGLWTVTVRASAVNEGSQGYALVAGGQIAPFAHGALAHDSHVIQDAPPLGNGDGVADPGETITIPVTLRNFGGSTVTGVQGVMTSDRPDVLKITSAAAGFPDIPANTTAANLAPNYRFTVSPVAACGVPVQLELDAQFDDGGGTTGFPLEIGQTRVLAAATGLPTPIPKKTHGPLTTTVEVTDSFVISDVHATVEIVHEDVGEIVVELTSPQGTTVRLHNGTLQGTSDLSATYDSLRQPDGPGSMGDFDFEPAQGDWTLSVQDTQSGPVPPGQIVAWSLDLESSIPINCSPLSCAEPVPGEVGPGLSVAVENGTDLRFTWSALAGADSYRVWSSTTSDFASEGLVGVAAATTLVESEALGEPQTRYYLVRAVNVCEWEGP